VLDKLKLSVGNLVILVAGVVMLLSSLLPFFKAAPVHGAPVTATVWSNGFFAIATLPALLGAVMAAQVALTAFATRVNVPEHVLGVGWDQIHLVLAAQSLLLMLSWLVVDRGEFNQGRQLGFWLLLLGSIALMAGAVVRVREPQPEPQPQPAS
jgi:hypothetical protein